MQELKTFQAEAVLMFIAGRGGGSAQLSELLYHLTYSHSVADILDRGPLVADIYRQLPQLDGVTLRERAGRAEAEAWAAKCKKLPGVGETVELRRAERYLNDVRIKPRLNDRTWPMPKPAEVRAAAEAIVSRPRQRTEAPRVNAAITSVEDDVIAWRIGYLDHGYEAKIDLAKHFGVEPKVGDTVSFWDSIQTSHIRGMLINGQEVYYWTAAQLPKRIIDREIEEKAIVQDHVSRLPEIAASGVHLNDEHKVDVHVKSMLSANSGSILQVDEFKNLVDIPRSWNVDVREGQRLTLWLTDDPRFRSTIAVRGIAVEGELRYYEDEATHAQHYGLAGYLAATQPPNYHQIRQSYEPSIDQLMADIPLNRGRSIGLDI